jgi:hypothetical protein
MFGRNLNVKRACRTASLIYTARGTGRDMWISAGQRVSRAAQVHNLKIDERALCATDMLHMQSLVVGSC